MSEFKGTPWPWLVSEGANHITVRGDNGEAIFHDDKRIDGVREDARLIAAAPELLEALVMMLSECQDTEKSDEIVRAVSAARSAIRKALGE